MRKKLLCMLMALVLGASIIACSDKSPTGNNTDVKKGTPDYSQETGFLDIDAWLGPKMSDAAYKEYVDCGYNMAHLYNGAVPVDTTSKSKTALAEHFRLAKANGVRLVLSMNALNANQTIATPFKFMDSQWKSIFEQYKDDDTFYGYMPYDEPRVGFALNKNPDPAEAELRMQSDYADNFDYIRDEYLYFSEHYPGKAFEVVISGGPNKGEFPSDFHGKVKTLDEYMDYYNKKVADYMPATDRIYSFDSYPFTADSSGELYMKNSGYFGTLENHSLLLKKKNAAQKWAYIQNENCIYNTASVLYQYYTAMCYGYTHFVTYCYDSEWCDDGQGSIDPKGNKTDSYYYFQNAHREIRSFENVYCAFAKGWVGTLGYYGSARPDNSEKGWAAGDVPWEYTSYMLESYPRIASVSSTQDLAIGVFKDKDDYEGFMVSNQVAPFANTHNSVKIKFNNADKAIIYIDGNEAKTVTLDDGVLELDLKSGGGAFVIPISE